MIFTLLWARSSIHCDLTDAVDRYLELRKQGNMYVVELMDMRHTPEGINPFTIEKVETKSYDEAHGTFCFWVYLFRMGKIHEEDNTDVYAYIESQHD